MGGGVANARIITFFAKFQSPLRKEHWAASSCYAMISIFETDFLKADDQKLNRLC